MGLVCVDWFFVARSQYFASAGTQLKSAGQREAAFAKYQQAVEVSPTYADGFYDLGVYYSEDSQVCQLALQNFKHHSVNVQTTLVLCMVSLGMLIIVFSCQTL